jgi:hypothetical protein
MGGWLTLNVTDIAVRVKRTFGDEAGVQIVDDDIIRWINEAQEEITNDNQGLLEATGVANIIQGQQDYSRHGNAAIPAIQRLPFAEAEFQRIQRIPRRVQEEQSPDLWEWNP